MAGKRREKKNPLDWVARQVLRRDELAGLMASLLREGVGLDDLQDAAEEAAEALQEERPVLIPMTPHDVKMLASLPGDLPC